MSYNGSGVYSLPGAQLANGEVVSATENNQFRNDVASALNTTWCRDGQAPATNNIPMGSNKFTGLAAGTTAGDSVRYEQATSAVAITGGTISGVAISNVSLTGLSSPIPVNSGGTGATTAGGALSALGAQEQLVSGVNIKTINGSSILGTGGITIPTLTDGDKGDITVSSSAAVWTIDSGVVTAAKLSTGAPSWNSSGVFSFNSGYGSNATVYGCRAWVSFNGTGSVAINGSGNVTSITDNGTGDYTIEFTNAMPDANYNVVTGGRRSSTSVWIGGGLAPVTTPLTTTTCRIKTVGADGSTGADYDYVCVSIFR